MIITFSGIDGSGKSTLCRKLIDRYNNLKKNYDYIHFISWSSANHIARWFGIKPNTNKLRLANGKNNAGKNKITKYLRYILILFDVIRFNAKYHNYKKNSQQILITDRYFWDLLIQIEYLAGKNLKAIEHIIRFIPKPDLAFYVNVHPEIALTRKPEHRPEYYFSKNRLYEQTIKTYTVELQNHDLDYCTKQMFEFVDSLQN